MQRVTYHAVRPTFWGLCWSSSLSHIVLQREVSTHSRDSVQFPYSFGIYLGCADATAGDPYGGAGATWSPVTNRAAERDRKSTRLNSSHTVISYAVFCLKKKKKKKKHRKRKTQR